MTKEILQKIGRDTAHTFKGLYKTADWLEFTQKWLLLIPIVLSLAVLIFEAFIPTFAVKVLILVSLVITVYVILTQREYDKIQDLRRLANEFKTVYDKSFMKYSRNDDGDLEELLEEEDRLRIQTAALPISWVGNLLCRLLIDKEMDLDWAKPKQEEAQK
jgi:hypothetical protein